MSSPPDRRLSLAAALAGDGVIVGDGAMGTLLHARGLPGDGVPELWNIENPIAVAQAHRDYVAAGARLVVTNTIGGTSYRLRAAGLGECVVEVNRRAAELARQAAGDEVWVLGSMGPTGQLIEPWGTMTERDAERAFAEQVMGLIDGGVDGLLIETQHALEEAMCAFRAARGLTDIPILCSFAFDVHARTLMGLRAAVAARAMESAGAAGVGANCGAGPDAVRLALAVMAPATRLPLLARANAGLPQLIEGRTVWNLAPEQMAEHALAFVGLGARLVGGCCGTTPATIASIARALAERRIDGEGKPER